MYAVLIKLYQCLYFTSLQFLIYKLNHNIPYIYFPYVLGHD
jgi:hypothetical protein